MTHRERIVNLAQTLAAICRYPVRFAEYALPFGDSAMREYVTARHGAGDGLPQLDLLDLFPAFEEDPGAEMVTWIGARRLAGAARGGACWTRPGADRCA
jgi:hypothetical protein